MIHFDSFKNRTLKSIITSRQIGYDIINVHNNKLIEKIKSIKLFNHLRVRWIISERVWYHFGGGGIQYRLCSLTEMFYSFFIHSFRRSPFRSCYTPNLDYKNQQVQNKILEYIIDVVFEERPGPRGYPQPLPGLALTLVIWGLCLINTK